MPWPVHPTGFLGAQGDNDTYKIERSLRFNSADSAYLSRTPASAGNTQKFTYSAWVKIASTATSQYITLLAAGTGAQTNTGNDSLQLRGNGTGLQIGLLGQGGTGGNYAQFSAYHRDPSSWQHVIVSVDTTQATQANRCRAYFNGVEETSAVNNTFGSAYNFTYLNTTAAHLIGRGNEVGGPYHTDAYLTEINFIDGQALTPSSFGETDAITGRWKAKAYSGTYGTNGFYLKFADNSGTTATTLGKDSSGNGNNWTPNNFSVTAGVGNDSLLDSPTNNGTSGNYCTFNAIASNLTQGTLYNGNLEIQGQGFVMNTVARGNMAILGKAYAEFYFDVVSAYACIGVVPLRDTAANDGILWSASTNLSYRSNGNKRIMGTETAYGATWVANNVIGVAVDSSANTVEFFKNGVSQGVITSSAFFAQGDCTFAVATDDIGSPRGYANFGQRPFAYTAPTGFKALCTTNLPTPTIRKPSSYMDVVTYTGNGSARSITGLGFSPDLVWIKSRANARSHRLADTVRGAGKELFSNETSAELTNDASGGYVSAFNSDGFTIGTGAGVNNSGETYVAWAWDEAPIAGMDIVSYTGNGTNRTIAHNLGVAPKMLIVKDRDSGISDWTTWHSGLTSASYYINLNSTAAQNSAASVWNSTAPTSSNFSLGTNVGVNNSGNRFIAYLFAEVEGFSKFGSYTGNGSADGPFVFTGHRPRWVMIKRSDFANEWCIYDSQRRIYNVMGEEIQINTNVESAPATMDFLSNGFKIRIANNFANASGGTIIYASFAESPFKYSRAR